MSNVREKLWIWGHEAGSHNLDLQLDGSLIVNYYNLPFQSRMTPAEAAFYLGVPNVIMVRYANKPAPPYDTYARSFCPLKQVVWSLIGDSSSTLNNNMPETEEVIELARKFPNITGVIMDDMSPERLRIDTLPGVRASLKSLPHPLDIWIVLYLHNLNPNLKPYIEQSDVITMWTWNQEDIVNLPANMDRAELFVPNKRKVLGCYLYDYGNRKPMLVENMRRQCKLGLKWLKEGRIEGMIFLASCICDLDLEAVEWTRNWIRRVGNEEL